jgi:hypothetical protein
MENAGKRASSDSRPNGAENSTLADKAIKKALAQLDLSSDRYARLILYYAASGLFQQVGDADGVIRCNKVLKDSFQFCEIHSTDEQEIKGASLVLSLMAYRLIPVQISDLPNGNYRDRSTDLPAYTECHFRQSEKLKLEIITMADRLPASSDVRRKAHRDLALWYMRLGKSELAEKQKQTLFELVGCKDDSILYPQFGMCGHVVWWQTKKIGLNGFCGMG